MPSPPLPPSIELIESVPGGGGAGGDGMTGPSGVVRFADSGRWGASVSLGGNDLFLGSFPTRTQASVALGAGVAVARGNNRSAERTGGGRGDVDVDVDDGNGPMPSSDFEARAADLRSVRIEDIVYAVQARMKLGAGGRGRTAPGGGDRGGVGARSNLTNFSLHDWTMAQIRRRTYLRERRVEDERVAMATWALEEYRKSGKVPGGFDLGDGCGSAGGSIGPQGASSGGVKRENKRKRKQSAPRRLDRKGVVLLRTEDVPF